MSHIRLNRPERLRDVIGDETAEARLAGLHAAVHGSVSGSGFGDGSLFGGASSLPSPSSVGTHSILEEVQAAERALATATQAARDRRRASVVARQHAEEVLLVRATTAEASGRVFGRATTPGHGALARTGGLAGAGVPAEPNPAADAAANTAADAAAAVATTSPTAEASSPTDPSSPVRASRTFSASRPAPLISSLAGGPSGVGPTGLPSSSHSPSSPSSSAASTTSLRPKVAPLGVASGPLRPTLYQSPTSARSRQLSRADKAAADEPHSSSSSSSSSSSASSAAPLRPSFDDAGAAESDQDGSGEEDNSPPSSSSSSASASAAEGASSPRRKVKLLYRRSRRASVGVHDKAKGSWAAAGRSASPTNEAPRYTFSSDGESSPHQPVEIEWIPEGLKRDNRVSSPLARSAAGVAEGNGGGETPIRRGRRLVETGGGGGGGGGGGRVDGSESSFLLTGGGAAGGGDHSALFSPVRPPISFATFAPASLTTFSSASSTSPTSGIRFPRAPDSPRLGALDQGGSHRFTRPNATSASRGSTHPSSAGGGGSGSVPPPSAGATAGSTTSRSRSAREKPETAAEFAHRTGMLGKGAGALLAASLIEEAERTEAARAAAARAAKLKRQVEAKRRANVVSKHLELVSANEEEEERWREMMERIRAENRRRRETHLTTNLEKIAAGHEYYQEVESRFLAPNERRAVSRRKTLHEEWTKEVFQPIQTAILTHVTSEPRKVTERRRREMLEAYVQASNSRTVLLDAVGGGMDGYDPFKNSQRPVLVKGSGPGGRLRDPTVSSLERFQREEALAVNATRSATSIARFLAPEDRLAHHGIAVPPARGEEAAGGTAPAVAAAFDGTLGVSMTRLSLGSFGEGGGGGRSSSMAESLGSLGRRTGRASSTSILQGSKRGGAGGVSGGTTGAGGGMVGFVGFEDEDSEDDDHASVGARAGDRRGSVIAATVGVAGTVIGAGGLAGGAGTIRGAGGDDGRPKSVRARVRAAVAAGGSAATRWTLPPPLWQTGIIEDTTFTKNYPLVGDPKGKRHAGALARGDIPTRRDEAVRSYISDATRRLEVTRERVLPDTFRPRASDEVQELVKMEQPRGKKILPRPAREPNDLFPVGVGAETHD